MMNVKSVAIVAAGTTEEAVAQENLKNTSEMEAEVSVDERFGPSILMPVKQQDEP